MTKGQSFYFFDFDKNITTVKRYSGMRFFVLSTNYSCASTHSLVASSSDSAKSK